MCPCATVGQLSLQHRVLTVYTMRERLGRCQEVDAPVESEDLEAYMAIYRYFPRFVEADL